MSQGVQEFAAVAGSYFRGIYRLGRHHVGRALSDPRDWLSDRPLLVLWEEIIHIAIVDSPEHFYSRSEHARALLAHDQLSDDLPPQ